MVGHLGLSWGYIEQLGALLGLSWGSLGTIFNSLGLSWRLVKAMVGHLETILGLCWAA